MATFKLPPVRMKDGMKTVGLQKRRDRPTRRAAG
jgi:hypothetical protein